MNTNFSKDMYEFTEKKGMFLPLDAHRIIKHRYQAASSFSEGKKVLEVGVGQGFGLDSIAKVAKDYVGIEYSKENIQCLKANSLKVIHGDAHDLPFEDSSFEIVNALAIIYYLDIDKFLLEVKRVLSLNGSLFFCTSNKNVPGFVPSPFTTSYYSIDELRDLLEKYGYKCKFYGSFSKYNNFEFFQQLKAVIKNLLKYLVTLIPYGKGLWDRSRQKLLGGLKILPQNFDDLNFENDWKDDFNDLSDLSIDSQHRVIYCLAELIKK